MQNYQNSTTLKPECFEGCESGNIIYIYSSLGRLIKEVNVIGPELLIDGSYMKNGLYLAVLSSKEGQILATQKIIKQ